MRNWPLNADLTAPFAHTEKQHTEMPSTEEVLCQCSAFKAETEDSPEAYLKICCCAYSWVAGRAAEQPLILPLMVPLAKCSETQRASLSALMLALKGQEARQHSRRCV